MIEKEVFKEDKSKNPSQLNLYHHSVGKVNLNRQDQVMKPN